MKRYFTLIILFMIFGCKEQNKTKLVTDSTESKEIKERKYQNELIERSNQYMDEEKYAMAIPLITEYINIKKRANEERFTSYSYYKRGQCKYYLDDYYGSLKDLKRAETISELEPAGGVNPNYYVYLAKVNLRL